MRISIQFHRQSEFGDGEHTLLTGWPMPGLSATGQLVSLLDMSEDKTDNMTASSMIDVGLSWKLAIGACVLGNFVMGLVITTNGYIGAVVSCSIWLFGTRTNWWQLHTPFPVLARMPFGYYFAYFVILSRAVLATVWLGYVFLFESTDCVTDRISVYKLQPEVNAWPSCSQLSGQVTRIFQTVYPLTKVSQLLAWLVSSCTSCYSYLSSVSLTPRYAKSWCWLSDADTYQVQYFFAFKSVIAPIIFLAIFGSTLHKAGGTVANSEVITRPTQLSGSVLAWAFFGSEYSCIYSEIGLTGIDLNGVLGNYATLGLNIADFSRYSKKPSDQYVQALVVPVIFSMSAPHFSICC